MKESFLIVWESLFMNNVLIVDDSVFNRKMMIEILKKSVNKIKFLQASNGQEALEIIYEKEVDLVILDLNMPVKSGYEVLKEIRKNKNFYNLPVIVNSHITDIQKVREALSLGAVDFFTKSEKTEEMEMIISTKVLNILRYYEQVNKIFTLNKKIENDLNIASIIQRDFLKAKKEFDDIEVYVHYEPLKKLSGDLFATTEHGDNKWILLVDMKSYGVSSALLSLFFRELFMKYAKSYQYPSELMQKLNFEFMNLMDDVNYVFFSAMIVLIRDNKVYICNAGHSTEPYIFSKNDMKVVKTNGRMIGIMHDSTYSDTKYDFDLKDCLILFTDGIFSRLNHIEKQEVYNSFKKIYEKLKTEDGFDVKKLTLNIYNEFLDKKNGITDDLTIACLKKIK